MLSFYRENARWLAGGFLLAFFSAFGQTFFIGVWGAEIRQTFGLTDGEFGLVYMAATLASALSLPFVGRLVDVTGVALCSFIVTAMLAFAAFSMWWIASLPMLIFTIYLLRLFGQGMMGHTAMTAMGRWYAANRGKAVSFASTGHQFSEAIAPLLFVAIAASFGWRNAWLAASACVLFIAMPAIVWLMRVERIPRSASQTEKSPHEVGRQWQRRDVLRDPLFWLVCFGVLSPAFIGTSIWFHRDYLIEFNNWSDTAFNLSFALMAVTTVICSLLSGFAIDRWSATKMLPLFMVPLAIACLILGSFKPVATIYFAMVFLGLSYGVSSSLFNALWPEIYGVRHLGAVRSIVMAFMVFSSAAGPGVTGMLIDLGIPFTKQLLFVGGYCLVTALLMLTVSRRLHERRGVELSTILQ